MFFYEDNEDRLPNWYENSSNLHLWLPFEPGDIVTYDSEPLAPRKNAVVLTKESLPYGNDMEVLFQNVNGDWDHGELQFNQCWGHDAQPMLSPLYRLSTHQEALPDQEQLLETVGRYIAEDKERADAFLKKFNDEYGRKLRNALKMIDDDPFSDLDKDPSAFSAEEILALMEK